MVIFRLLRILAVASRYRLDQLFPEQGGFGLRVLNALQFWRARKDKTPQAVRLRLALESLGPIFVKFGQMLSTRRDLLPVDIADELALLQDRVPPFSEDKVKAQIEEAYGRPIHQVFTEFEYKPVASASIAQVHFARLPGDKPDNPARDIALKILRPGIRQVIEHDLQLLDGLAWLVEKLWRDGKRLRPREVIDEFGKHLETELNLLLEAANCTQLRRNFSDSDLLAVPEVYWDWCTPNVMAMQRMDGIPVSQIEDLKAAGVDLKRLSAAGVEIFFTQVFRHGFFHADMHPGNIFVSPEGQYIALDFGIIGTLNERDKNYLALNFLAFFQRDYKRVAEVYVELGWVPPDTRIDEFESAIRAVCEPVFDRPLKEIYFGKVLARLFQTSRHFQVEAQPQLALLAKTLINIEGLGRQLDPDLDLWTTAKPYLERWMSEQTGWHGLWQSLKQEAPWWPRHLPKLPRLLQQALEMTESLPQLIARLERTEQKRNRWLRLIAWLLLAQILMLGIAFGQLFLW